MSITSTSSLEQKLLTFFKEMALAKENNNYESDREKFVFHMTDWQDALDSLKRLSAVQMSMTKIRQTQFCRSYSIMCFRI
jgi:hypothetical protein